MAVTRQRLNTWYYCMIAALCMVLYGYDASVFNSVQASQNWLNWFNLDLVRDAYLVGLINTAYTIGAIIAGFFAGGPISDYLGRKWGMWIGCFITIIATFIQTFAPYHNLGVFIAGRCLIGIGQGIALTSGPVYIGEMAPAEIRGWIMAFWQLNYSTGSFIAYWINYSCSLQRKQLGEWDWKMVVIFQILVPIIICVLLPFCPESPRWYLKKNDNVEGARATLMKIRNTEEEVEDEIRAIREAISYENEAISSGYSALFKDPSLRKRMLLAMCVNAGQQLTGQGTLNSYSTSIYKKVFTSTEQINLINALNATFGIFFTLPAVFADRYGRRMLFIVGAIGMGCAMLGVSVVGLATPEQPNGAKTESVGIAMVFLLFTFILFYKPTWGATTWIWTSEIFSVNVRAQAVGMCSQTQNVANTIFSQFFPKFLAAAGLRCLFFFMAVNWLLVVFVYFCIPETKQVPLEEIDVLFGGANHVDKGAKMMGIPEEKSGATHIAEKDGRAKVNEREEEREANKV